MKNMTYRQLAESIEKDLTDEQKDSDVTVFVEGVGEFYATENGLKFVSKTDTLDKNHPFLKI